MEAPQGQQEISGQQFSSPEIEVGIEAPQDLEAATPEPEKPFAQFISNVLTVAISEDGRIIAVGLADGTIEIWDLLLRKKRVRFSAHENSVTSVAMTKDGQTIVSGGTDEKVRLWDRQGQPIGNIFTGHGGHVYSVAISKDGETIVSGGEDGTVRLWNRQGEPISDPWNENAGVVRSVAISSDGETIVSSRGDQTVRLWNRQGQPIGNLFTKHEDYVTSVAISEDGQTIVSGGRDGKVWVFDREGESLGNPFTQNSGFIKSVTISSDGKNIVTENPGIVRSVAISSDGQTIVSAGSNQKVWLSNRQGELISNPLIGHESSVYSVAISNDGKTIVSGGIDRTVRVWNRQGQTIADPFSGHPDNVTALAISHDGETIVSAGEKGTVHLWDKRGQPLVFWAGHLGYIYSVAISNDGQTIVTASSDHTLQLWDRQGNHIADTFTGHEGSVYSVAISSDGEMIVSGGSDATVRLWNPEGKAITNPITGHQGAVKSVTISQDGQTVVSGDSNGTVRLWNREGKAIANPLNGHQAGVKSVTISQDGQTILSSGEDGTVRLWNREGKPLGKTFLFTQLMSIHAGFSPDGSTIVTGSDDGTVRLWDVSDPQRKRQIEIGQHQREVCAVVFDPQGDYIFSASKDGIKVWHWEGFNIRRVSQPFSNDQPTGEDSLDVAKELQSLADVLMLRSLQPPLAVAILGGWGSGKSFGMHLIEKQITKIRCQQLTAKQTWGEKGDEPNLSPYVGHVYQIKFNAWSYAKSDLWASLMQTIFDQLDRQLTLEKQLGEVSDLLAGGEIWRVINQMNDSDRKAILESELTAELFANLQDKNADSNALWDILSQVRQEEQEKLKRTEEELRNLEAEVKNKNQEIEDEFNQKIRQIEQSFNQEVNNIEANVEQEMTDLSILIVFLSQLKETLKDDFGDSILKDFLHICGFKDRKDLEAQFPMLKLDKLSESNLIDIAQELVTTKDEKIQNIVNNVQKITHFLEEQPSQIVGLIEFTKKDRKTLFIFLGATALPFIAYFVMVAVIPKLLPVLKELSIALKLWVTSVCAIPSIYNGIEIFKRIQVWQVKTVRFLQVARENVKEEKQKLNQSKEEKIKAQINQRKEEYEQSQVKEIFARKELATQELTAKQQEIEKLQLQVERQKQRVGLTAQYTSLLDFVNNRLEDNSYQKLLGIMHQIQDDLQDLSEHLTYQTGRTNPDKIKDLKPLFPRGPARIVLYIDDLDRCPPDRVVQVLEAVQLLLNTELFIVILAIDDRYIGRALEHIYRGVLKRGGTPSGVDYLEKIIQIPYRMRPISKDVTASYLKSLVDIEEEAKKDNQEDMILQQTRGENTISSQQINEKISFLKGLEEFPENIQQDEILEIPVVPEKQTERDGNLQEYTPTPNSGIKVISQPRTEEFNSETNRKIQHSANTEPLVSWERFTAEEFQWISESCQHVDLTPRTAKRLINIGKIIKIIWTPLPNDTTWKQEPKPEYKQTLIAFLALAGRYPKEMRKLLEEIYLEFEETDGYTVIIKKDEWLDRLQKQDVFMDRHNQREWKKFKNDLMKMSPQDKFYFEKRTFNLARSFCFVGDVGYDPDDYYNREYRFEDRKKDYGFQRGE
ncbi:hypothetical protein A0J48_003275 [Sphaerospermopsis aphanizomenoides BCCUSP55]|uniref:P-loop NTPase fold protein n=1 Tax=Sphaerospermopsis aphanizomenoides TaxID=459663 RepID=UPI00190644BC|nr:P-loop NTPase fold protein [Sphaerospermopsis aphanizomenoides]MBK1986573.1 hypothetical protein [Sphaerospermopsis aphanizomenoides BCCUSP55]